LEGLLEGEEEEGRTVFMFSARRSYSSRTSCSSGESSGGEVRRELCGRGGGSILDVVMLDVGEEVRPGKKVHYYE
jgi:hypothetical protein